MGYLSGYVFARVFNVDTISPRALCRNTKMLALSFNHDELCEVKQMITAAVIDGWRNVTNKSSEACLNSD